MAMLVGQLARQAGCSAETIRYYEREGLLKKPPREVSGYRNYSAGHLGQLNFILRCRSLGITLAEIRTMQHYQANPDLACAEINDMIDHHITHIQKQIEQMHLLEKQLRDLRKRCNDNSTVGTCGILQNLANVNAKFNAELTGDPCCNRPSP